MEVSSQAIRDVQFREKLRGYHPEDVDHFVARVADAVEMLLQRAREAEARAAEAESGGSSGPEADESVRRMLVLAQRTADLAIQEARDEAAGLIDAARAEHEALRAEAEEFRRRLADDVESEVRAELDRLQQMRDRLLAEVSALESYLEAERDRLRGLLEDELAVLDEGMQLAPPPPVSEREVASVTATALPPTPEPDVEPEPVRPEHDDPFIAELRRAVTDEEPLGPRDESFSPPDLDEADIFRDEGREPGRFGARLRRRR